MRDQLTPSIAPDPITSDHHPGRLRLGIPGALCCSIVLLFAGCGGGSSSSSGASDGSPESEVRAFLDNTDAAKCAGFYPPEGSAGVQDCQTYVSNGSRCRGMPLELLGDRSADGAGGYPGGKEYKARPAGGETCANVTVAQAKGSSYRIVNTSGLTRGG